VTSVSDTVVVRDMVNNLLNTRYGLERGGDVR